jgi:hypothetical protein
MEKSSGSDAIESDIARGEGKGVDNEAEEHKETNSGGEEAVAGEKVLTRMAEVYENERYQLSTMNWSYNGLLINDR